MSLLKFGRRTLWVLAVLVLAGFFASGEAVDLMALDEAIFGVDRPHITGTFFDIQHHSSTEAIYWNYQAAAFTDEMWEQKVEEIADLGMEYIVVMSVALHYHAFYPSEILPMFPLAAEDPIKAVLEAAQRRGVKVFLGAGFFGDWTNPWESFTDRTVRERTRLFIKEMSERYGHYESFYGFYWPNELGIDGYFPQQFINHVKECNAWAKEYLPRAKTLIAPYGTNKVKADDRYVAQLKELGVDIIAYQDEVGVMKTDPDQLYGIFKKLKEAHDKTDVALWADMEIFTFSSGSAYSGALLPADINRIRLQLKELAPFVEEIICYQYIGLMDKPGSLAPLGPVSAQQLYVDYVNYLEGLPTIKM